MPVTYGGVGNGYVILHFRVKKGMFVSILEFTEFILPGLSVQKRFLDFYGFRIRVHRNGFESA